MLRLLTAIIVLGAIGSGLYHVQQSGQLLEIDHHFEDFLIANSRSHFDLSKVTPADSVLTIAIHQDEAAEYESWPPSPLEWRMILDEVQKWQPELLVITEPLQWTESQPEFLGALERSLQQFPSVVLGVEALLVSPAVSTDPPTVPFWGELRDQIPHYPSVKNTTATHRLPRLQSLLQAPERSLRPNAELGIIANAAAAEEGHPIAFTSFSADDSIHFHPTLLSQALTRVTRSPYSGQRLRLGTGAGLHLARGHFFPLNPDGTFDLPQDLSAIPQINALDLLTGTHAGTLSRQQLDAIASVKHVFIGIKKSTTDSSLEQQALTLAHFLSLPQPQRLQFQSQWIIWAGSAILSVFLVSRGKSLTLAILLIFTALTLSYLMFESTFVWCPPTLPAALLLSGGLLSCLFPRQQRTPPGSPQLPAAPAQADSTQSPTSDS
jgi:CHASE2 domain-containing sensor protein